MARVIQAAASAVLSAEELESYRQLIELQKKIVMLAQQNERAKLECAELRENMAAKAFSPPVAQRTFRAKVGSLFGQSANTPTKSNLISFIVKEQSA